MNITGEGDLQALIPTSGGGRLRKSAVDPLQSTLTRSSREPSRAITLALPLAVCGPVDRSHDFQFPISPACRVRRPDD